MQYDAQLQKGICAYELGKHGESAEATKILFDAEPQNRPFLARGDRRLQGVPAPGHPLRSEGPRSRTRKYEEAVKSIEKRFLKPSGDEFDLTKLSPALEPMGVLVELEYGVALAGTGQGRKGLDVIQRLIGSTAARGRARTRRLT